MTYRPIPELPEFTKADAVVYRLFGAEEALAIRRLADEMTLRHNEHHPVIRYAMAETAILSMMSYEPGTRGELMHAARLVSLSMLQTDLAHEVAQPTATVEQKVRLASEVMRLERTICQSEKHFAQRQAARKAAQPPRSEAAAPAARAGDQTPSSTVTSHPNAEAPRAPGAAAAPATPPATLPATPPATPPASAAAAPASAGPAHGAPPAAPAPAARPATASAAAPVSAAPTPAAQPAAAPASTAARPPTPALAPQPPYAGASRTAGAAHPGTPPPGPPGPRTAAVLDLDDPPDGVTAAVRDELERAMALGLAIECVAPPPSPGFGQAARP
jgi:hypothetical protein